MAAVVRRLAADIAADADGMVAADTGGMVAAAADTYTGNGCC